MRSKRAILCTVFLIFLLAVIGVFALAYFMQTHDIGQTSPPSATESPALTAPPTASPEPTATPEPTPTPEPEPTPEPTATPRPFPDVPLQDEPAPEGYFEDAVFIGNSLVDGLKLYFYYGNLDGATYYTGTSLTIFGAHSYMSYLADGSAGKLYVGLGMNEIDYDKSVLREQYTDLIETARSYNPDVIIYLMSVTPVSKWKDQNSDLHNMRNVESFNVMLRDLANQNDCYYMDLIPVLAGEDGYLPSDVTEDGVHFTQEYYTRWFDYLENNYVLPASTAEETAAEAESLPEPEAEAEELPVEHSGGSD